jgi:tetratricopeptide (TPR) repeat protein
MKSRVLGLATLLVSVCAPLSAGEAQWVEVRSPNFSVISDAGEKRAREAALHFEQMRAVFAHLMVTAKVTLPMPLQIVAFRNTKEMRQFAPIFNGKATENSGLFLSGGDDRSYILLDMSLENPWKVVFHEYAHQLMNGKISTPLAPWFEEGFAEYFSSIELDSKQARVGKIPEDTYRIMEQSGWIKAADLFQVRHYYKTYNESGDHRNAFYAESSFAVHYLFDNNMVGKAATYFDLVENKKTPVDQAIPQAFGKSAADFDKALHNYATSGKFLYYAFPLPPNIESAGYSSAAVDPLNANALLAEIHIHELEYQDRGAAELQEILKAQPNNAAALRNLGVYYLRKQDLAQAGEYFQRALQLDSTDPRVLYYSAMLMQKNGAGPSDAAKAEEMKKNLEKCIALDPSFADAYSLLAYARLYVGDKKGAVEASEKAVTLSPRNEHYLYNLSQIYLSTQNVTSGIALLKHLQSSSDPQMASMAEQGLKRAEDYQQALQHSNGVGSANTTMPANTTTVVLKAFSELRQRDAGRRGECCG